MPKNGWSVQKIAQLGLLFALAIILMLLEGMIPPIPTLPPGIKLGLSNIVVMYCLFYIGKGPAFTVLMLKSAFVFLTRGGIAFLMSFSGGICSIFVMILLISLKKVKFSYIMISVCAAVMHNVGQLLIASLILYNSAVFYYAPVLVLSGIGMGIVTGILLRIMMPAMQRMKF